jgi:hypothetical protein
MGAYGFHLSSCQFAFHYMWKSPSHLANMLRNVAECTKMGGYFIGTTYDGRRVFDMLRSSTNRTEDDRGLVGTPGVWEIEQVYPEHSSGGRAAFPASSECIGMPIRVYQESFNKWEVEYLVHFDYLREIMQMYGFETVEQNELRDMGLPRMLTFQAMYEAERAEMRSMRRHRAVLDDMTKLEKTISFLNRAFVFKKVKSVIVENIELDTSGFERRHSESTRTPIKKNSENDNTPENIEHENDAAQIERQTPQPQSPQSHQSHQPNQPAELPENLSQINEVGVNNKDAKAQTKAEKAAAKAVKAQEKADRAAAKAQEKADRAAAKAQEKADRAAAKAQEKADRAAAKAKKTKTNER